MVNFFVWLINYFYFNLILILLPVNYFFYLLIYFNFLFFVCSSYFKFLLKIIIYYILFCSFHLIIIYIIYLLLLTFKYSGKGYSGRLCGSCVIGYYKLANKCEKCPDNSAWYIVLFTIIVLCICLVLLRIGGTLMR